MWLYILLHFADMLKGQFPFMACIQKYLYRSHSMMSVSNNKTLSSCYLDELNQWNQSQLTLNIFVPLPLFKKLHIKLKPLLFLKGLMTWLLCYNFSNLQHVKPHRRHGYKNSPS